MLVRLECYNLNVIVAFKLSCHFSRASLNWGVGDDVAVVLHNADLESSLSVWALGPVDVVALVLIGRP